MENKKAGNMLEMREKILEFVKTQGPVLPVKLSKEINSDITLAGAILSELVASKKVKVSSAKIGGSPVYYIPGQEGKLQMLEAYLHGREKDAYKLLKEKRLIWEGDTEPWQRVALKDLKDFAVPIKVHAEDGSTISFWKWYLASDDEIKNIIPKYLEPSKQVIPAKQEIVKEEIKPAAAIKQDVRETRQEVLQDFVGQVELKPVMEIKLPDRPSKRAREKIVSTEDFDDYFARKNIEILSKEASKKGREIDAIAYVPSQFGKIRFFIAYRSKKKLNEADVGMVYSKSQAKNMPAILIGNGELTKKAREYLDKELRSVTFYKI